MTLENLTYRSVGFMCTRIVLPASIPRLWCAIGACLVTLCLGCSTNRVLRKAPQAAWRTTALQSLACSIDSSLAASCHTTISLALPHDYLSLGKLKIIEPIEKLEGSMRTNPGPSVLTLGSRSKFQGQCRGDAATLHHMYAGRAPVVVEHGLP